MGEHRRAEGWRRAYGAWREEEPERPTVEVLDDGLAMRSGAQRAVSAHPADLRSRARGPIGGELVPLSPGVRGLRRTLWSSSAWCAEADPVAAVRVGVHSWGGGAKGTHVCVCLCALTTSRDGDFGVHDDRLITWTGRNSKHHRAARVFKSKSLCEPRLRDDWQSEATSEHVALDTEIGPPAERSVVQEGEETAQFGLPAH